MTLTAAGASVWASGSHVCNGNTGTFTAKPANSRKKVTAAGTACISPASPVPASSVMFRLPVEKYMLRMPASIKAEPASV
jgi:uncharacterized protein (DUF2345 family)